jgi:hypothetical protein
MAEVVSLEEYRTHRDRGLAVLTRLERAVGRLEGSVQRSARRMTPTVERELLQIVRAVSSKRPNEAARRAERLASLLEHPATARS